MRKQPTSIDVARLAGVSQTTVSFVLNNRSDKVISADTRARVLRAATELRYRSNKLSNGILRGKTKLIGVVVPSVADYYFAKLLTGISGYAHRNGYQILVTILGDYSESMCLDMLTRLIEYRVDGIIGVANDWDSEERQAWLEEVIAKRIPVVIVDDSTPSGRTDCIITDDFLGAHLAVSHLIAKGCKRIAHLCGNEHQSTGRDRLAGYLQALRDAEFEIDESLIVCRSYNLQRAAEAADELLALPNRPDAVFAASDLIAVPLVGRMVAAGLRSPSDIAIVGYSNNAIAEPLGLTTIEQHPEEIGLRACAQLLKRSDDVDLPSELIKLPVQLIERATSRGRSAQIGDA